MSLPTKRKPRIGSLTTSVSLALMVHGALLLLVIGFTIDRVARPTRLTDSQESLNSVLLQEPKSPAPAPTVSQTKAAPTQPVGSPDGVKVAVAIPTTESAPVPKPSEFHPKATEGVPSPPPPPRPLGNPAPPRIIATAASAPAHSDGRSAESGGAVTDGAATGVVAFTSVKGESAKRIVYVIDGSGSMAVCLPFIRSELLRSVARLDDSQSFQIVVFRDPPPGSSATGTFTLNPRKLEQNTLLSATDLNKSILREWLDSVQPLGRSTPLTGIEQALALKPDLIFLLSRGIKRSSVSDIDDGNRAVLERLEVLNPIDPLTRKRRTVIKALQFIDDDPTGLMQSIGKTHGDASESYKIIPVPDRFRGAGALRAKNSATTIEKN